MNNLINIKAVDESLLIDALSSFQQYNECDFYDLLTNESIKKNYYNKNKKNNFGSYIKECNEIYDEINLIIGDTLN